MTIDERLQFLVQSTESLHASCQQLHATTAEHTRQFEEHTQQFAEHTKQLSEHTKQLLIDADNIRRLATIAGAHQDHVESLAERLDRLEGKKERPSG